MHDDHDELRDVLQRKVREAARDAAAHDGAVPSEQLDALNRLARLVEVRDRTVPSPSARWRIAAILGATLLIVSLLLFLRVRETQVEIQAVVSEAGFELERPQVVTGTMSLKELGASGLRGEKALRVTAVDAGTITLDPLNLPAGVEVRIDAERAPSRFRLLLRRANTVLRATAHGSVQIDTHTETFAMPRALPIETDPGEVTLDLHPVKDAAFSPQLFVRKLALSRVEEFHAPEGTTAQAVSTIAGGTIYFESLNGQPRPLRPRELLRFDEIRGVIRTLELEDGGIALAFRGDVRGMSSGWSDDPVNLMPTWLEWLKARHGLSLLWGTTLYLFGLAAAILRWWKAPL